MKKIPFVLTTILLLLWSCSPHRDLVYFSNLSELSKRQIKLTESELRIQTNDLLSVTMSSLNPESDQLFAGNKSSTGNVLAESNGGRPGFRVNSNGIITLPIIGNIKVEGLRIDEVQHLVTQQLTAYVGSPVVSVQLINFKITVIGEVNRPASFTVPGEKINLLEALGMAGDMTVYGKRENVLVIREVNGERNMVRLNLNQQEVFQSPYFHLQQNDVVYVEPDKSKEREYSPNNRILPIITACISAVAVLLTALIR